MIYDTLDTIPYKTFIKIADTGNVQLLSDTETDEKVLQKVWDKLYKAHQDRDKTPESKKIFRLTKQVEALTTQHRVVLVCVLALSFEHDEDLVATLRGYRYTLRDDNTDDYYEDLQRIEREANALKFQIAMLKKQLPKEDDNEVEAKTNEFDVDDVMASYTMITGYDFDYNTVTYTKFYAIQKQVHLKIKAVQTQQTPAK